MRDAITDPAELLELLALPRSLLPDAREAASLFPLRVPRGFVARMRRGDPNDPLLRQVLPLGAERARMPGFGTDPVGDLASAAGSGILHKYAGRALLIATGVCAVNCRYCFRRHFPYDRINASREGWREALEALAQDSRIAEVILSGGDPLSLNDRRLSEVAAALDAIPHLRRLRVHTRQPVVLPERIDDALLQWLSSTRLQRVVVIHANHAQELDRNVAAAVSRLREAGSILFNQSVLLAGVNDTVETLTELSERLFEIGVTPYYLHLLDKVQGSAHFEVPEEQAAALLRELRQRLPGYLVPRLAREEAGKASKTIVA